MHGLMPPRGARIIINDGDVNDAITDNTPALCQRDMAHNALAEAIEQVRDFAHLPNAASVKQRSRFCISAPPATASKERSLTLPVHRIVGPEIFGAKLTLGSFFREIFALANPKKARTLAERVFTTAGIGRSAGVALTPVKMDAATRESSKRRASNAAQVSASRRACVILSGSDMSRSVAKFTESDMARIFKAAHKTGVNVKVEIRGDAIIVTTVRETANTATAEETLTAEDELERWRKKRGHARRA
jgi:hypothetical protein